MIQFNATLFKKKKFIFCFRQVVANVLLERYFQRILIKKVFDFDSNSRRSKNFASHWRPATAQSLCWRCGFRSAFEKDQSWRRRNKFEFPENWIWLNWCKNKIRNVTTVVTRLTRFWNNNYCALIPFKDKHRIESK